MTPSFAFVIAGTHSGVGKTTVSIAFMAALRRRGFRVQPFKVGPDFIDPTLHTVAAGRIGRNIDGWMLSPNVNRKIFCEASVGADIAVIEGVMGLFDGRDAVTEAGSTAEMAKLLGIPILLVVDAKAMARSAAAVTLGFENFDSELSLFGVIFNRVGGQSHFAYLRDAVAKHCTSIPLGWLERDESIELPQRHLGLWMGDEVLSPEKLEALANWLERHVNLDELLEAIRRRQPSPPVLAGDAFGENIATRACIGVARDAAFGFYYQDNLDLLKRFGARLVEFSPILDTRLPNDIDGLYFGGGYPELYAEKLAANVAMKNDVLRFIKSGAPVYAECGGFMYLMDAIVDRDGREHEMIGAFPTRAVMQKKIAALGYAEVKTLAQTAWIKEEMKIRGHEFHYSMMEPMPNFVKCGYVATGRNTPREEGFFFAQTLASYIHLHFYSCPTFAERFVSACARQRHFV